MNFHPDPYVRRAHNEAQSDAIRSASSKGEMRQYEFEITHRTRRNVERARATARTPEIARWHIVLEYGSQFDVEDLFCDVNPAHQVLGEIDCTDPGCETIIQGA
jgi:hypothetical protein